MTTVEKQIIRLKIPIFVQVLFSFLATGAMALIPVYHKWLVDKVLPQGGKGFLALAILYLATYLFFLLTTWIAERFIWRCAICFENQMKKYWHFAVNLRASCCTVISCDFFAGNL